jgi:predicted molibdopterin-dependent oxidoreductase YjgC
VQRFLPARAAPGMARPGWWAAAEVLSARPDAGVVPGSAAQVFRHLAGRVPALAGLSHEQLGFTGRLATSASGGGAAQ